MKRIAVLGSTGSIGTSTLAVVDAHRDRFEVRALVAGRNAERLIEQVRRYEPPIVAAADAETARRVSEACGGRDVLHGEDGRRAAATDADVDLVVCGLVGALGLESTRRAVEAGKVVALANKESLVVGGEHLTRAAARSGALILPVDSEHNAIHQCLRGEVAESVARLWLTASGGPFRCTPLEALERVTVEEALDHPTWKMGAKITIDSATLMNKGLEVIEARFLFDVEPARIDVVVHPQSVVHSMVELRDGSFKAQLGNADMRHPIQYALTYPERLAAPLDRFDPRSIGQLDFEAPDENRFPCLRLAREALERGGVAPAVLNAANEVAVEAFLDRRIGFTRIPDVVERVLEAIGSADAATLDEVMDADRRARGIADRAIRSELQA